MNKDLSTVLQKRLSCSWWKKEREKMGTNQNVVVSQVASKVFQAFRSCFLFSKGRGGNRLCPAA